MQKRGSDTFTDNFGAAIAKTEVALTHTEAGVRSAAAPTFIVLTRSIGGCTNWR